MKSCLIVDDSRVVRKVARKILEELGFECDEAENGQLALDKCKESMPQLIMLDWNMPVMTGIQFIKALRATPEGVSDDQSVLLTDAMATAHFGLTRTGLGSGDTVAVVGLGPIGLIGVELAMLLGASRVFALDPVADPDGTP